jgi:flagellar basal-body rod modification protein FlgD
MTTAVAINPYAALNSSSGAPAKTANEAGSADRFLKLLVTQMQNQDPLNPMDNAQITSQMAQINTVNGIETLNTSVQGLSSQFVQLQALSGAALVGHEITLKGNKFTVQDGKAAGGFELDSTADTVKVEILSAAGRVVDTVDMGAESAGRSAFVWNAPASAEGGQYSFRVVAKKGAADVSSTPLIRDQVQAVSTSASGLVLQTKNSGDVAYADVKAFN